VIVSGMSGNEIYCLSLKGYSPGEITVGNSVYSLGFVGALGAMGRQLAGGEIHQITSMISEGRHAAIRRMEEEAQREGAAGVAGVRSELRTMAGFTEFLSQGTAVHTDRRERPFFSCATSGIDLYCHLDSGYHPIKFVMGNVAYALGIGRGLVGTVRTLDRGEVVEFSRMYNDIRHVALERLKEEARQVGGNAVVDVSIQMIPHGPGQVELLMTGTASHHPSLPEGGHVATSELSGEEVWNLASLGLAPHELVMATSVYSLGLVGGIGAMLRGLSRGEIPEVTELIYQARENALKLLKQDAERLGAERVIGNRLQIRELSPGLIEVVAVGTAVRRASGMAPHTPQLIPQAVIADEGSRGASNDVHGLSVPNLPYDLVQHAPAQGAQMAAKNLAGCLLPLLVIFMTFGLTCMGALLSGR
jgi:uncharacterized protein YbjQ (UPF0145 family)